MEDQPVQEILKETQEDILHLKETAVVMAKVLAEALVDPVDLHLVQLVVREHLMHLLIPLIQLTLVAVAVVVILLVAADQVVLVAAVMVVIDQAAQVTQDKLQQEAAAEAAALMAEAQAAEAELEE